MKRIGVILTLLILAALALSLIAYLTGYWMPALGIARLYQVRGVDISNHQGEINWALAASDKIAFAYIKATEGGDFRDQRFAENWKKTAEHGIARGAYHYFRFKTSGKTQAENFISMVPRDPSALPPAVDLEFPGSKNVRPGVGEFRTELNEFLRRLRSRYGKEPVIYTNSEFYNAYLKKYPMPRPWIRDTLGAPDFPDDPPWLFWQFADKGRVKGIKGFVDLNVFSGASRNLKSLTTEKDGL